jgi:phosphoribosylglycinamide formyltransferase-1
VRLAILISGAGTTLQNFIDAIDGGDLDATIAVVASNNAGAFGLERARQRGIPAVVAPVATLADAIDPYRPDLVLLAGFIKLWTFPERYRGRVLNVHPALLPKFGGKGMYGDRVHQAVLDAGEGETGCTVHVADHEYDHGPILLQRRIPVRPDDTVATLRKRVQAEERIAYPEAVRRYEVPRS